MPKQTLKSSLRIIMTEQNHDENTDLTELYQQRKTAYKAPSSVKRHIIRAAKKKKTVGFSEFNLTNWTKGISLAAATVLLISLVAIRNNDSNWFTPKSVEVSLVEFHSLNDENVPLSQSIKVKYARNFDQYLNQQQTLANHHSKNALLRLTDEGWELTTCNDELLKISAELVLTLRNVNRIEEQLKNGDRVDIVFNQDGHIMKILQANTLPHC
ncbi:MAG: hypothetical protein ACI88A_004268 [Paraglaciecola sp.]|jgi:hypothetical protein